MKDMHVLIVHKYELYMFLTPQTSMLLYSLPEVQHDRITILRRTPESCREVFGNGHTFDLSECVERDHE